MKSKQIMTKRFCLVFGIVFVVSSGVCAFGQNKDPNAAEILRHYRESLSWLQSVSMKVDIDVVPEGDTDKKPHGVHFVFRHDHGRAEWLGQIFGFDEDGNIDPLNSHVIRRIMTGERCVSVIGIVNELPRLATIRKDCEERQKGLFDSPEYGGALFGKMYGSSRKGVAELLGESANFHLRDGRENINGAACYVLEGTTKYGKVTAWVAPEKGYNALKWTIHKTGGDLFDEKPISSNSWLAVFGSVEVQQVNGVFVTTGGCLTHTINFTDGHTTVSRFIYKVSEVEINPDFETLGAFKIDLPDGTRVYIPESPGIKYVWQNGKAVPDVDAPTFEEIDKIVEELKKEK